MNHYVTDAFTGIGMAVTGIFVVYALLMWFLALCIWFFNGR
jgi:hypothetical protein